MQPKIINCFFFHILELNIISRTFLTIARHVSCLIFDTFDSLSLGKFLAQTYVIEWVALCNKSQVHTLKTEDVANFIQIDNYFLFFFVQTWYKFYGGIKLDPNFGFMQAHTSLAWRPVCCTQGRTTIRQRLAYTHLWTWQHCASFVLGREIFFVQSRVLTSR